MTTYTYPPVRRRAKRRITCLACGKRRERQMTFEMTINPFNRNPDGTVRTPGEIADAVQALANAWAPTLCASCEPLHRPSSFKVARKDFTGDCVCGNRWPCELTEDYAELAAQPCLCQPVNRICARCLRLGRVFDKPPCCDCHREGGCLDPDDGSPCCANCPNRPRGTS